MSDSHSREIVGFVCRWLLLAGAGAAVVAVTWASLLAAADVSGESRAQLTLRDWVAPPGPQADGGVYLKAYLDPPASRSGLDVGLLVAEGHPLGVVRTYAGKCGMLLDNPQAGTIRILARGAPYSAIAFQARRCRLLCVPQDRLVFLVDARMALAACGRRDEAWPDCLRAMKAVGEVALFHPGPWRNFLQCRRELRAMGLAEPILFDERQPDPICTLARVGSGLCRRHRCDGIEVVTADPELARQSAGARFITHLVADAAPATRQVGPLRRHRSLANLKDFLSRRPIAF
ncbi:MAG: hypothetical protein WBF17_10735 [Phycisphaerae bacterium]